MGYFLDRAGFSSQRREWMAFSWGPGRGSQAGSSCRLLPTESPILIQSPTSYYFERFLNPDSEYHFPILDIDFDDVRPPVCDRLMWFQKIRIQSVLRIHYLRHHALPVGNRIRHCSAELYLWRKGWETGQNLVPDIKLKATICLAGETELASPTNSKVRRAWSPKQTS